MMGCLHRNANQFSLCWPLSREFFGYPIVFSVPFHTYKNTKQKAPAWFLASLHQPANRLQIRILKGMLRRASFLWPAVNVIA